MSALQELSESIEIPTTLHPRNEGERTLLEGAQACGWAPAPLLALHRAGASVRWTLPHRGVVCVVRDVSDAWGQPFEPAALAVDLLQADGWDLTSGGHLVRECRDLHALEPLFPFPNPSGRIWWPGWAESLRDTMVAAGDAALNDLWRREPQPEDGLPLRLDRPEVGNFIAELLHADWPALRGGSVSVLGPTYDAPTLGGYGVRWARDQVVWTVRPRAALGSGPVRLPGLHYRAAWVIDARASIEWGDLEGRLRHARPMGGLDALGPEHGCAAPPVWRALEVVKRQGRPTRDWLAAACEGGVLFRMPGVGRKGRMDLLTEGLVQGFEGEGGRMIARGTPLAVEALELLGGGL